jgi:hypothetical protein
MASFGQAKAALAQLNSDRYHWPAHASTSSAHAELQTWIQQTWRVPTIVPAALICCLFNVYDSDFGPMDVYTGCAPFLQGSGINTQDLTLIVSACARWLSRVRRSDYDTIYSVLVNDITAVDREVLYALLEPSPRLVQDTSFRMRFYTAPVFSALAHRKRELSAVFEKYSVQNRIGWTATRAALQLMNITELMHIGACYKLYTDIIRADVGMRPAPAASVPQPTGEPLLPSARDTDRNEGAPTPTLAGTSRAEASTTSLPGFTSTAAAASGVVTPAKPPLVRTAGASAAATGRRGRRRSSVGAAGKLSVWHLLGVSPFEVSDVIADAEADASEGESGNINTKMHRLGLHVHGFHELLGRIADVCFPQQLTAFAAGNAVPPYDASMFQGRTPWDEQYQHEGDDGSEFLAGMDLLAC